MERSMVNILELPFPHGYLVQKGKQTAIASDKKLATDKPFLIVTDDDVFGNVTLKEAAEMKLEVFDQIEWHKQHRVDPRERRQWWPDADKLYVYPISEWQPLEKPKLFVDGEIIDEPQLSVNQQQLAYKSKQLPKQIPIVSDVVGITEDNEFIIDPLVKNKVADTLAATYEVDIKESGNATEFMPVYSLALVRNPRMRMAKKNDEVIIVDSSENLGINAGESAKQEEGESMPWRIEIRDGQHCVIKVDGGDVEGCHNTRPEAVAQLAALNISEGERQADIQPDTKNTWLGKIKSAATALADLLMLTENNKEMDFPEDMFKGDSGFAIKTVNGAPWHFTWSTNAFKDREGEIFSTKALEQYVTENEQKKRKGFFNFWHINEEDGNFNTDFAEKQWQGVIGRFLVEAGPYLDNENGQAALKFFQEFPDGHPQIAPEGWGCSPEFRYLPEERAKGVYEWLFIVRTSTLPRAAAANIWTQAKQEENIMALSEQQKEAAIALLGSERVEALITEGEKRTTDLEQADVAHKGDSQQEEIVQPQEVNLDLNELAKAVSEHITVDVGAIGEVLTVMVDSVKQLQEDVEQLKTGAKVKEQTETPRYILNVKRASEADETQVGDDDSLKDKKPQEKKPNVDGSAANIFFGR